MLILKTNTVYRFIVVVRCNSFVVYKAEQNNHSVSLAILHLPYLSTSLPLFRASPMATILNTPTIRALLPTRPSTTIYKTPKAFCASFRHNAVKHSRLSSLPFSHLPSRPFVKFVPFASSGETETTENQGKVQEPQQAEESQEEVQEPQQVEVREWF